MNWDFVFLMVTLSLIYSQLFQNERGKQKSVLMSTFCLPDIRNTTNYEILCGRITTGELWTHSSNHQAAPGFWAFGVSWQTRRSRVFKNSDCAAKRQVRATQCLIQVCVIQWMMCLAPIGCFSLSVIHHPLLLSAPFRVRHSGSSDFVSTYPCVFLHYIHEPPLRPSSFPPPWQLHLHPLCSFLSLLCTCPKHLCLPCLTI